MYKYFFRQVIWAFILLVGSQIFTACDSDDPEQPEPDSIIGLWTFESQELAFFLNGEKVPDQTVEDVYAPILGVELDDFQIPDGSTFEFKTDGTFEGNAEGFDTQTGNWLLSDDDMSGKTMLNLSSDGELLFLDVDNLPELAQDVFFEEDGSINFEVLSLTQTNAGFFLSGETEIEFIGTQTIRVDLTVNLVK